MKWNPDRYKTSYNSMRQHNKLIPIEVHVSHYMYSVPLCSAAILSARAGLSPPTGLHTAAINVDQDGDVLSTLHSHNSRMASRQSSTLVVSTSIASSVGLARRPGRS